jgi:hypothetical protein
VAALIEHVESRTTYVQPSNEEAGK